MERTTAVFAALFVLGCVFFFFEWGKEKFKRYIIVLVEVHGFLTGVCMCEGVGRKVHLKSESVPFYRF